VEGIRKSEKKAQAEDILDGFASQHGSHLVSCL
jgi:hypothetical protein